MPSKHTSRKKSRSRSKGKTPAQKRHQERATRAMKMFKSGKVTSLKRAWAKV